MSEITICWCAFAAAVLAKDYLLPEQAFGLVETGKRQTRLSKSDIPDIIAMRKNKVPWAEIGEIYGVDKAVACRMMKGGATSC